MNLSNELISQFAKITKDNTKQNTEKTVNGTAVIDGEKLYAKLDGSDRITPVTTTAEIKDGERITVVIKDHTARATGNMSSPAARLDSLKDVDFKVDENGNKIAMMDNEILLQGNKIAMIDNVINMMDNEITLQGNKIAVVESTINILNSELTSQGSTIGSMNDQITSMNNEIWAHNNKIGIVESDLNIVKTQVWAHDSAIGIINSSIEVYNSSFKIEDGVVTGLKGVETEWITTGQLEADSAKIKELDVEKLSAKDADIKYANIDFTNIGSAAMEHFYANSGLIKDVIVGDQQITGELIGVTIKGDLIEADTIKADKLVVQGSDGLYYKLNVDGSKVEAEQTEYNSLNGSVIIAKSITATKIAVDDLVAFDATIGGFNISDSSIYSGVKQAIDNTTRGIYLDNTGQLAVGDSKNYIKFYKDQNGLYKLAISASELTFGVNNTTIDDALANTIKSQEEQFYHSISPTVLKGGSWSNKTPTWENGKYVWVRTLVVHGDNSTEFIPSENGVCISGNTGADGTPGSQGPQGVQGPKGEPGEDGVAIYCESYTQGSVQIKTMYTPVGYAWSLSEGKTISVKFSWGNTAYNPKISVNGGAAKEIRVNNEIIKPDYYWADDSIVMFIYNGTCWDVVDSNALLKANEAAKTATNYMNFDSDGLVIGDMKVSTLGRNVQINSSSVNIRNDQKILASFGESLIELGKNSASSMIKLCGSVGVIKCESTSGVYDHLSIGSANIISIDGKSSMLRSNTSFFTSGQSVSYSASSVIQARAIQKSGTGTDNVAAGEIVSIHRNGTRSGRVTAYADIYNGYVELNAIDKDYGENASLWLYSDRAELNVPMTVRGNLTVDESLSVGSFRTNSMSVSSLTISGTRFTGDNKELWYSYSGSQMNANTIYLDESISSQTNGIVLVFSVYDKGAIQDYDWIHCYVPKETLSYNNGGGHDFFLCTVNMSKVGTKYLYIYDTYIRGSEKNQKSGTASGVTYNNSSWMLRYVIGV